MSIWVFFFFSLVVLGAERRLQIYEDPLTYFRVTKAKKNL